MFGLKNSPTNQTGQVSVIETNLHHRWQLLIFNILFPPKAEFHFFKPLSVDWLMFLMKVRWSDESLRTVIYLHGIFYLTDSLYSQIWSSFPAPQLLLIQAMYCAKLYLFFKKKKKKDPFYINEKPSRRRVVEKTSHIWKSAPAQQLMLKVCREFSFGATINSFLPLPVCHLDTFIVCFCSCFCG